MFALAYTSIANTSGRDKVTRDMLKTTEAVALLAIFVLSGVMMPLLTEVINSNGGCEKSTLLITLPDCVGGSVCILTNWSKRTKGQIDWRLLALISMLDFMSHVLNLNGLMYCGSAVFTIIYSSMIVYTAVFARIFLNRKLCTRQWLGVVAIGVGLSVASMKSGEKGEHVELGIIMTFVGALSHSATYIISEYLLLFAEDPIAPEMLGTLVAVVSTSFVLLWQATYTAPRFQALVVNSIAEKNGSISAILVSYSLMVLAAVAHALCFYRLIGFIGSTSTGVCKSVQSVTVFIASHVAFCGVQKSRCFSYAKGCSLLIVLSGVMLYSVNQRLHLEDSELGAHKYEQIDDKDGPEELGDVELTVVCSANSNTRNIPYQGYCD